MQECEMALKHLGTCSVADFSIYSYNFGFHYQRISWNCEYCMWWHKSKVNIFLLLLASWNFTANVLFINRCCQVTLIRVVQFLQTSSLKRMKMKVRVKVAQNNHSYPCYSMTSCNNPVCCRLCLHTFEMILVSLDYKLESLRHEPSYHIDICLLCVCGWALKFMWYRNKRFL
jgi:hypothetical protein